MFTFFLLASNARKGGQLSKAKKELRSFFIIFFFFTVNCWTRAGKQKNGDKNSLRFFIIIIVLGFGAGFDGVCGLLHHQLVAAFNRGICLMRVIRFGSFHNGAALSKALMKL